MESAAYYQGVSHGERLSRLFEAYLDSGNEKAIEQLVRRTRPRLLAVARRIGASQDAEDSVQAAYLALIRRRPDAEILAWLITVVVRIAYRRKALERKQLDLAWRLQTARDRDSVAAAVSVAERDKRVRSDIARLPPKYRDPIVLHYLEGLTTEEVARLLDRPVSTVRTHLQRGRQILRGSLRALWALGLFWLVTDAAATGGVVMKKKTVLAGIASLLALGAAGLVYHGTHSATYRGRTHNGPAREPVGVALAKATEGRTEQPAPELGPVATGLVQEEDGQPVAGARVELFLRDTPMLLNSWSDRLPQGAERAQTNEGGLFRIPLREDVPALRLLVSAAGFSPAVVERVRAGADVVVTLERGPVLTGAVTNLQGEGITGARVTWWTMVAHLPVERVAVSDEEGRYRIEGLPSPWLFGGGYAAAIRVDAEDYAPLLVNAPQPTRRGPKKVEMDLILARGATMRGRVLDGHTGRPIGRARVLVKSVPFANKILTWAELTTDDEGRFVAERLPCDGFHAVPRFMGGTDFRAGFVRVECEGFATATVDFDPTREGETVEVEVNCWPVGRVRGRVLDARGRPLQGVKVHAYSHVQRVRSSMDPGGSVGEAITDANGRYDFPDSPGPGPMKLSFYRGWQGESVDVDVRPRETVEVEDVVWNGPQQPAVTVEVVDGSGKPVWNSLVKLTPRGGMQWTDRNGRVRLWADREGRAWVEASSPDSGTRRKNVVLKRNEPQAVRLVLDATKTIKGEVRYADGTPAVGVMVRTDGVDGVPVIWTDRAGRFVLRRLPEGKFDLVASCFDAFATASGTRKGVPAGATGVVLTLSPVKTPPMVSVGGSVFVKGTDEPVLLFEVTLAGEGFVRAKRLAPGRFRFDRVPVGTWTLRVHAEGYGSYEQKGLVLRQGTRVPELRIELAQGARVQGRVRGGKASMMALVRADGFKTVIAFVTPRGEYALNGVPPGRYRPQFLGLHDLAASHDSVVEIGEDVRKVRFDVRLVPGTMLLLGSGHHRVVASDGTLLWDYEGLTSVDLPYGIYEIDGQRREVSR